MVPSLLADMHREPATPESSTVIVIDGGTAVITQSG
jgi:hypothetical protein